MRLNTSTSLFVASSLFCLGSSLPFFPRKAALDPRATYSVVPVDGGSSATTNTAGQGEVTIVQTVTNTPATQTIVTTDTLPPTTDIIVSTQTIAGPKTTQTVDVTLTPAATPVTVTATEYSVIDISAPTTIVLPLTTTPTSRSSTKTSVSTLPNTTPSGSTQTTSLSTGSPSAAPGSSKTSKSAPPPKTTSTITPTATPSETTSSTPLAITSAPSTLETSYTSSFTTSTSSVSTSSASYDNGQWHTSYPLWSNSTATLKRATPAQTSVPMPIDLTGRAEHSGRVEALVQFLRRSLAGLLRSI